MITLKSYRRWFDIAESISGGVIDVINDIATSKEVLSVIQDNVRTAIVEN